MENIRFTMSAFSDDVGLLRVGVPARSHGATVFTNTSLSLGKRYGDSDAHAPRDGDGDTGSTSHKPATGHHIRHNHGVTEQAARETGTRQQQQQRCSRECRENK